MTALLSRLRLDASAAQSVDDLAQVKQIDESAQIVVAILGGVHERPPGLLWAPIGPSAGMSDRLPSGKTTRTRRTPRRRMLLITASDWPSKAWRSRVTVAESGTSRRWVVCGCFLRQYRSRSPDAGSEEALPDALGLAVCGTLAESAVADHGW